MALVFSVALTWFFLPDSIGARKRRLPDKPPDRSETGVSATCHCGQTEKSETVEVIVEGELTG
ncbi:MAG: hypothetical protein MI807_09915 [Verrucomicrobiales bacterium]|nr:hypothetical protein [Verrucomicrobiales bacterium]